MVQQGHVCKGSVAMNSGCLDCSRCQQEVVIALPKVRAALKAAESKGQVQEVIRLRASLVLLELAAGRMGLR